MNAKVGNIEVYRVAGKYGVGLPGVNENGERLVEVCSERRLHREYMVSKEADSEVAYTREGENGQERSLIDYVLADEMGKNLLEDVNKYVYRGAAGGSGVAGNLVRGGERGTLVEAEPGERSEPLQLGLGGGGGMSL